MIHAFKLNGKQLVFDVESGSLHAIDDLVFDLLANEPDLKKYSQSEISQAQGEINELKKQGMLYFEPAKESGAIQNDGALKALCLHVCHDCNLRCKYCFAGDGVYGGKREALDFDTGKAAIDFLIKNSGSRKNLEIDFFGGEPLMNFDILKRLVEYGKNEAAKCGKVFKFTTTTNGLLLTKEVSDYLNAEMENVVLSLDGRKEVNDGVRITANGKGSFDLIKDNFLYFKSIRAAKDYFVRGTFTAQNLDFSKDVLFLNDLGFDQISIEPVVLPEENPLAIRAEHLPLIFSEYEALASEYIKRRASGKWFSFFHFAVNLENGPCIKKRISGCGAGKEYLAVTPDGSVYPCHQFAGNKKYLLGSVKDGCYNEMLKKHTAGCGLNNKYECVSCWAKYHCGGGCSANAVHFNGDFAKPYKIGCELLKKRLECALYIYAVEHY